MRNKALKDILIVGFAVFAVFFGGGNTIFPPGIGLDSGSHWISALAGLALSGIAIPILSIIATANMGGTFTQISQPVGSWFEKLFMCCALFIVPFITGPRVGGVACETGFGGMFPSLPHWTAYAFLAAYFIVTYFFANQKSKIVDYIGKYLTPVLLAILFFIVIMAFVRPVGTPTGEGHVKNAFSNAFIYAYQLGDLLTGLVVASIYVGALKDKGYTEKKAVMGLMLKACGVAFLGLFIIYGGLLYLGACGETLFPAHIEDTVLIASLIRLLLGNAGMAALGIALILACLTTSIGLLAIVADFIEKLTRGKISFHVATIIVTVICIVQASGGVNKIIQWSGPVFLFMYPMAIVLTICGLFGRIIPNNGVWKGAVITAMIVGAYDSFRTMRSLGMFHLNTWALDHFFLSLPFASAGFTWIVPCIVGAAVGGLLSHFMKGKFKTLQTERECKESATKGGSV